MIQFNDLILAADVEDIINTLKVELAEQDIARFSAIKSGNLNVQTNCPFHKNGAERKPSFGINQVNGKCHCFACGWSGTIETMISSIYGKEDNGAFGKNWLIRHFNSTEVESRQQIVNLPRIRSASVAKTETVVSEEELDSYRYYHRYMYQRGLTDELIEKFDIGYDKATNCLTFPLSDVDGKVLHIARRSVVSKFYQYPENSNKPIFGLFECLQAKATEVYICESFFNALTLWKLGLYAVALLGTGADYQFELLNQMPFRSYVLAFDPDEAGRKAVKRSRRYLGRTKIIKEVEYLKKDIDINDLQEDFLKLRVLL